MKNIQNLFIATLVLCIIIIAGCTQNQRAKQFGGTATMDLPPHQKLVCVSWEEDHLWVLYRPMRTNETAESYILKENSSWGILQGTYQINEK